MTEENKTGENKTGENKTGENKTRPGKAKPIMIQGTMSNAGKSLIAAGLCRVFMQDGYRTAPFKSQNMALNSWITDEGLEMGRAQVVQAEAAGVKPQADMNPILLKPVTDSGSQVIVHGTPIGNMAARDYFAYKKQLIPEVEASYRRLEEQFDIIVIEGAGSPAEINLKQDDIVNMGMAKMTDAPVLLVGDIDRGGVFAQLFGTVALLTEEERARICGLIINKFRGDKEILRPGLSMLEDLCKVPVLGVVPFADVDIEDEDSLGNHLTPGKKNREALADIAVIRFTKLSNFTDFTVFTVIAEVGLRYVERVSDLGTPDLIILPGTKNTVGDLLWMRENGLEAAILKLASKGVPIFGICGGYQMLGESLEDPYGVESARERGKINGMGLLPVRTIFGKEKTRTRVSGSCTFVEGIFEELSGMEIEGYEIHMGETARAVPPMAYVMEDQADSHLTKMDGCQRGNIYGTYIHGFFDRDNIAKTVADALLKKNGVAIADRKEFSYKKYKEEQYDRLADIVRESLDMEAVYAAMGIGQEAMRYHKPCPENVLPADIERRSFEIITEELGARKLDPENELVIKRVIHTTADFDYVGNLVFSDHAAAQALKAIREGVRIITDTNMGKSGINRAALLRTGCRVDCFMADQDVAEQAKRNGTTRAYASMEKAASLGEDCIFAIGNAPTALIHLYELIKEKKITPRLIIGVPVGFVNVVQSKELILSLSDTPFIVARGRKGGSNVAAAICNALLYQASPR